MPYSDLFRERYVMLHCDRNLLIKLTVWLCHGLLTPGQIIYSAYIITQGATEGCHNTTI